SSPTGGTVTVAFDRLGRQISYTDADGGVTRTEYDLLNRPVKITDNSPSTVTYAYDQTAEPRGLPTGTTDSVAGTFSTTYDADGGVSGEGLPGGYSLRQITDPAGQVSARTYTRDSDAAVVYSDSVTRSARGQVTKAAGWSDQSYRYDRAGRIVSVDDTHDTVCTRRSYALDARSNRTSVTSAAGTPGADCSATGGTTANHTYDSADRLVDSGYSYDAFGRTTALPGSTNSYYANDRAHRLTAGGKRQTFQLDSAMRARSWTVETGGGSTWTQTASKVNHYSCACDSPRWIVEDTTAGTLTRMVDSAASQLSATTSRTGDTVLQLTNIHGDVALQLPLDPATAPVALDADEFGVPRAGQPASRYGWMGAHQRSTETVSGLTLMGIRLYHPAGGRFLQQDPIPSTTTGAYDYAGQDPRNGSDISGAYRQAKVSWGWTSVTIKFNKRGTSDVAAGMWVAIGAAFFIPGYGTAIAFALTVSWFIIDRMANRGYCVAATKRYFRSGVKVWFYKKGFCK
ncbi:RHS repeat-associated core domain-containing protein, partial [Streptomyces sp. NPDC055078]